MVECPTPAQVMIAQFMNSSPTSGSVLMAQSLQPASDSVSLSLSLSLSAPPPLCSVSLCLSKIIKCKKKTLKKNTGVLIHRGTSTPMFIAALSTIAELWTEPKCPSTGEWIRKMWFIYTMEYYLAMRKNTVLPSVTTWMELESVMLSEISQAEKVRYHMFSLLCGS